MKAPILCWRRALVYLLILGLYAWLYPPAREGVALLVLFVAGGLILALGIPHLRDVWLARTIRRVGRRVRPVGRSVIPPNGGAA